LLLQPVVVHITKVFAVALLESEQKHITGQTEVHLRRLSEVPCLMMRESSSVKVSKCIYTRLAWPTRNGGLERTFIQWAQADTQVLAFCKISENRHTFARLRYVKDDGLPAFCSPDFLLRTKDAVYLVETKAQAQTIHLNVQRKLKAALAWCGRINDLTPEQRSSAPCITCYWLKTWCWSGGPWAHGWPSCWITPGCVRWQMHRCKAIWRFNSISKSSVSLLLRLVVPDSKITHLRTVTYTMRHADRPPECPHWRQKSAATAAPATLVAPFVAAATGSSGTVGAADCRIAVSGSHSDGICLFASGGN
jgi:hypothetical protein